MTKQVAVRAETGLTRRTYKSGVNKNIRGRHLSAGDVGTQKTVQEVMISYGLVSQVSNYLFLSALFVRRFLIHHGIADRRRINRAIRIFMINCIHQIALFQTFRIMDTELYDIPAWEKAQPVTYSRRREPLIDDLSDAKAHKMTNFYVGQLKRIYAGFGLEDYARRQNNYDGNIKLFVHTGWDTEGTPCCYRIHPEHLFLYALTKQATGRTQESIVDEYFGGDYARWSNGYKWIMKFLAYRFDNVIGHQGLARRVKDFPRFNEAIERYAMKDRLRQELDGSFRTYPGLRFLPRDIVGFIDCTIDRCSTPLSGPRGNFVGAARKADFDDAQRAVYTGHKKLHGTKFEGIVLPDGTSTVYGPVSARRNDLGVLSMSQVFQFLEEAQEGRFVTPDGDEVIYSLLGDSIYDTPHRCIQTYYKEHPGEPPLSDEERTVNHVLKAGRMTIEKSFGMVSNIFRITASKEFHKLGEKDPYVVEQARVSILLINCYVCLNGDQAGTVFGLYPPKLQEYLAL